MIVLFLAALLISQSSSASDSVRRQFGPHYNPALTLGGLGYYREEKAMSMSGVTGIIGYYHPHGYNVWLMTNGRLTEEIYEAGNNPGDSTSIIPVEHGESVETLRVFCEKTCKEYANELRLPYFGCDLEADPYEGEI